ncbi:MAG: antitoxin [Eggerthellaceae bacterium]|nr:antitoxin [Eggerthellaceae bacterium]
MAQLCVYLDEPTMKSLRADSEKANLSLSRYVSKLINEKQESTGWPDGYWSVYGALNDDTFTVPCEIDPALDGALPAF